MEAAPEMTPEEKANEEQQFQIDLSTWYTLTEKLDKVKTDEMVLRLKIFKRCFPNPVEGTNSFNLADGYVLKAKHNINRKVDEPVLTVMTEKLQEREIVVDDLFKRNPTLVIDEYRKLTEEQLKIVDQCLEIKPGAPQMEIVQPKRKKT